MNSSGNFDVLGVLCEYLTEKTGVLTSTETPDTKAAPFITIFRNGGGRQSIRYDRVTLTIWIWANSEAEAYALTNTVRNAMEALSNYANFSAPIESAVRINNPDDSGLRRYEVVYFLQTTI